RHPRPPHPCPTRRSSDLSITPYGAGCPGTGQQPSSCAGVNTAGGSLSNSSAPNEYAYEVSSNSALTVVAVEVFTRALSGTANVRSEEHTSELQSREPIVC